MDSAPQTPTKAARLTYDRDYLLKLQPLAPPKPEIIEALKPYSLTKGAPMLTTPKKTPLTPKPSPSKVYVLKSPVKEEPAKPEKDIKLQPKTPIKVTTTPNKIVKADVAKSSKPQPQTTSKATQENPAKVGRQTTAKPKTIAGRVPLGVVKGPRPPTPAPVKIPGTTSFASKENMVNRPSAATLSALPKLVLPPAAPPSPAVVSATAVAPSTPVAARTELAENGVAPVAPVSSTPSSSKKGERESDPHRLAQRQKQIEYGKKTVGYERYISMVPKEKREPGQPITPRKNQKCSKRSWDGQVRKWRRELHKWDPEDPVELAKWTAIVKEKYGDCLEEDNEEYDYGMSPSILNQAKAQLLISEVQPVNRTLVF